LPGLDDALHTLEVPGISEGCQGGDRRHAGRGLRDDRTPGAASGRVVNPREENGIGTYGTADTRSRRVERHHCPIVRRQCIDQVVQRRVDEFSQRVSAARSVGEYQATERRESRTRAVGTGAPLLAGVWPHGPEVVVTDRERCEFLVATDCEAQFVSRVDQAPTIVDDRSPMAGITQRDRDLGQRRVLG
jgi:hypothetical protein